MALLGLVMPLIHIHQIQDTTITLMKTINITMVIGLHNGHNVNNYQRLTDCKLLFIKKNILGRQTDRRLPWIGY
jgi:type III secretory pathway component EscS